MSYKDRLQEAFDIGANIKHNREYLCKVL